MSQLIFILNAELKQIRHLWMSFSTFSSQSSQFLSEVKCWISNYSISGNKRTLSSNLFLIHNLSHFSSMSSSFKLECWIQVCGLWGWPIFGIQNIIHSLHSHNLHQYHPRFTLNAEVKYRVTNYGHLWRAGVGTEAAERPDGRRWNTSFSKNARLVFEYTHLSIILICQSSSNTFYNLTKIIC